jgi:phenylalanyl-tRNA synthetase beta chain
MKISYNWLTEFVDIPDDAKRLGDKVTLVGLAVDTAESLGNDTVFELDITTNRPDCLNHLGVAREVSAIYGKPLKKPTFEVRETGKLAHDVFSISIAVRDLCVRYCGRYIAGL